VNETMLPPPAWRFPHARRRVNSGDWMRGSGLIAG
jgi:hypothetical protein